MIVDFINENDTVETCEAKIKEYETKLLSTKLAVNIVYSPIDNFKSEIENMHYRIEALKMHIEYLKGNYKDVTNEEL